MCNGFNVSGESKVILVHPIKKYVESGGTAPLILNLSTVWR
jgi:hypothetical protein